MKITRLFLTTVIGLCLTIGMLWLLGLMSQPLAHASKLDCTEESNPKKPTTEFHVCSSGCPYSTIQAAVDAASSGDLIKVAEGNYTDIHERDGITQVVYISKSLTIQGGFTSSNWILPDPENNPTILDAQDQGRGVYIAGEINVMLEGFQIRNGDGLAGGYWGNDTGGGIYIITATAMISDNEIYSNYAESGGGIYVYNAQITLSGNTIYTNSAAGNSGGVFLYQSSGTITGNTIRDNLAGNDGGMGVSNSDHVTIEDNLFEANTGTDEVGGLEIDVSEWITITGNTIISNTGYDVGGGVFILESNDINLIDNQIIDNQAESSDQGEGGGLYLELSTATIEGNEFRGNYAQASGGGIFDYGSTFTFYHNTVCENQAGSDGGGVSLGETNTEFNGNLICENSSEMGGGLALWEIGEMVFVNDVIVDNHVSGEGSAISAIRVSPAFLHTTIARNSGGDGSAILVDYGQYATHYSSVSLTNTVVVSHSVGITVTSGNTVTINGILWDPGTPITVSSAAGASVSIQNQYTGDPAFSTDGYHLTLVSDAIDHGVNAGVNVDIDGDARPLGPGYDLGADEIDVPISGLTTTNDSPTQLGDTTNLSATISGGTNVIYTWDFGDGESGSGAATGHVYGSTGVFTAVVTASNSVSLDAATTVVRVDVPIAGLVATNDSPTQSGGTTHLAATISAGSNVTYDWYFGDGETGNGAIVDHVYSSAGVYTAVVTATNSVSQEAATTTVTIEDPIVGLYATNDSPTQLGQTTYLTATLASGTEVAFIWDFGDGASEYGATVAHVYPSTGVFTAVVTSTNSVSQEDAMTEVTISDVPVAGLAATNDSPTTFGHTTHLTATIGAGSNVSFQWDFGDGAFGSGSITNHIYESLGAFTAEVTASNSINQITATTFVTIEEIPIAGLTATNNSPTYWGAVTTLTATISQGSNVVYLWDFGDGEMGYGIVVTHTYPSTGTFTAVVTATNSVSLLTDTTFVDVVRSCWARLNNDPTDYPDIQSAVDASSLSTDVVKVAGYCLGVNEKGEFSQQVYVDKSLTIRGGYSSTNWDTPDPSANPTTIDALGLGRAIYIPFASGITPRLEGLRITGGYANGFSYAQHGGGVYSMANSVVISTCQIFNNSALEGGGVALDGYGTKILANSEIYDNIASESGSSPYHGGGGIRVNSGKNIITGNKIHNNHAQGYNAGGGGLLALFSLDSEIQDNQIYDNTSDYQGGGVKLNENENLSLTSNMIHNNASLEYGGGVYYYGEINLHITTNQVYSNTTVGEGGGIFGHGATTYGAILEANQVYSNTANYQGGGLSFYYHINEDLKLRSNQVYGNASQYGGGIYLDESQGVLFEGNCVENNYAVYDGGSMMLRYNTNINLSANHIRENQSDYQSAGIYLLGNSNVLLKNNLLLDNYTSYTAGKAGISIYGSSAIISHNTIAGNGRGIILKYSYGNSNQATLRNNILVNHDIGIELETGTSVDMDGTLWGAGAWANKTDWVNNGALVTGTVNLWVDPGFLNPAASDYHITTSSAAKDVGVSTDVYDDVDSEARPFGSGPDIGFDEWATSETSAEPGSPSNVQATVGTMVTTVEIPAGAVTETTTIQFTALASITGDAPAGYAFAGLTFGLDAYIGGVLQEGFVFNQPITITIQYNNADVSGLDENNLKLYYWDEDEWVDSACGAYDYHPAANWFAVPICHLSRFALFGEEQLEQNTYLPLVLR
jgi:hypothetical protein